MCGCTVGCACASSRSSTPAMLPWRTSKPWQRSWCQSASLHEMQMQSPRRCSNPPPVFSFRYLSQPVFTFLHLSILVSTCLNLSASVSTCLLLSSPVSTCLHSSSPVSTCQLVSSLVSACLRVSPSVLKCTLTAAWSRSMSKLVKLILWYLSSKLRRSCHPSMTDSTRKQMITTNGTTRDFVVFLALH
jgi:hypothetical protein